MRAMAYIYMQYKLRLRHVDAGGKIGTTTEGQILILGAPRSRAAPDKNLGPRTWKGTVHQLD